MQAFERLAETGSQAVLNAARLLVAARAALREEGEPFFEIRSLG
jgi:hypothetical protein